MRVLFGPALTGLCLLTLASCDRSQMQANPMPPTGAFDDITIAQWERLSERRIFFGHQSVGGNILDGVRQILAERPELGLRIVSASDPRSVEGGALIESLIGTNGVPETKSASFVSTLTDGGGEQPGVAMFKYCYLDIGAQTDIAAMFTDYQNSVAQVRARNPDLTIVHLTVPLTTVESAPKRLLKGILGKPTQLDINRKRNIYNELLRAGFRGDPIFDLARIESSLADGGRSFMVEDGDTIYTLSDELTDDGGHLNETGQRLVAGEYLAFLARLP